MKEEGFTNLDHACQKADGTGPGFLSIVASGYRSNSGRSVKLSGVKRERVFQRVMVDPVCLYLESKSG